jgi:hypothetical protein
MLRPNAPERWTRLYPDPATTILEVNLSTPSLLDPDALAAAVESGLGFAVRTLAYRALGDLVRDRVPRALTSTIAPG